MVMARSPKSIVRPIRLLVVHAFTTLNNARYALLGSLGTPKRNTSSKQKGARHVHIAHAHVSDYFSCVVFEHGENRAIRTLTSSHHIRICQGLSLSQYTERVVVVVMLMVWINKMFCNDSRDARMFLNPLVTLVLYSCRECVAFMVGVFAAASSIVGGCLR